MALPRLRASKGKEWLADTQPTTWEYLESTEDEDKKDGEEDDDDDDNDDDGCCYLLELPSLTHSIFWRAHEQKKSDSWRFVQVAMVPISMCFAILSNSSSASQPSRQTPCIVRSSP